MDQRNFLFLCYGLAAVWVILILYLLSLAQRSRKLREELDRVKKMIGDQEEVK